LAHWKSLYRAGKLDAQPPARARPAVPRTTFMPVSLAPAVRTSQQPTRGHDARGRSVVQLTLASGATLRLESDGMDAAMVCALVAELRG
ncbi:MAG: hypothetical protein ACREML_01610, partial [Vulcanimicrobiaceae bacterium]